MKISLQRLHQSLCLTRHGLVSHCILISEIRQHARRIVQVTEQHLPNSPFQFLRRNAQAGEYPVLLVVLLSQRTGYTSARPRNRRRNSATFSPVVSREGSGSGTSIAGECGKRHSMPWDSSSEIRRAFSNCNTVS